jgi:hypothetical protein
VLCHLPATRTTPSRTAAATRPAADPDLGSGTPQSSPAKRTANQRSLPTVKTGPGRSSLRRRGVVRLGRNHLRCARRHLHRSRARHLQRKISSRRRHPRRPVRRHRLSYRRATAANPCAVLGHHRLDTTPPPHARPATQRADRGRSLPPRQARQRALTKVRRRVTWELGDHRGRKLDPEWANRRRLLHGGTVCRRAALPECGTPSSTRILVRRSCARGSPKENCVPRHPACAPAATTTSPIACTEDYTKLRPPDTIPLHRQTAASNPGVKLARSKSKTTYEARRGGTERGAGQS